MDVQTGPVFTGHTFFVECAMHCYPSLLNLTYELSSGHFFNFNNNAMKILITFLIIL